MRPREILSILEDTADCFLDDKCPAMAAALAYYTIFALPPLLVLVIAIAGAALDEQAVRGVIEHEMSELVGPSAAEQAQTMITYARERTRGGLLNVLIGIVALLFGATGAFAQLQAAFNEVWKVTPNPGQGKVRSIKRFLAKRFLSFGLILAIAFLLLVSLVISALLSAFSDLLRSLFPVGFISHILWLVDVCVSLGVSTLLLASLFKVLPDARIAWRQVWLGAAVTGVLFALGKLGIGFYLGRSNPGDAYGAAGSLVVILFWVYASALILLLGAQFTRAWSHQRGLESPPARGAVRLVRRAETVEPD